MGSKKSSNQANSLTKKDLVNYIGPIFEELKVGQKSLESKFDDDLKSFRTEVNNQFISTEARLVDKINFQGTVMEDIRREIRLALEVASTVLNTENKVSNSIARISVLERDVQVLKGAVRAQNSPK